MNLKVYYSVIFFCFLLLSCKNDDDGGSENPIPETTVSEDKANVKSSFSQSNNCLSQQITGTLRQRINTLFGGPNAANWDGIWVDSLISEGGKVITEAMFNEFENKLNNENRVDFSSIQNNYVWNSNTGTWSEAGGAGFSFAFPLSASTPNNNVLLKLEDYKDTPIVIDGTSFYLPTSAGISMSVNNIKLFRFDLTATYDNEEIPVSIDFTTVIDGYSYTLAFDRSQPDRLGLAIELLKSSGCGFIFNSNIVLKGSNYDQLITELNNEAPQNVFKTVSANLSFQGTTVSMLANMDDLILELDKPDPSYALVNSYLNVSINHSGQKVADMKISDDGNNVHLIYKDGSAGTVEELTDEFINLLENTLTEASGDPVNLN